MCLKGCLRCLALILLLSSVKVESAAIDDPLNIEMAGSVMDRCVLTLVPADMQSRVQAAGVDPTNKTQLFRWSMDFLCSRSDLLTACLKEELDNVGTLTKFDQILAALLDLPRMKLALADVCARLDYVVQNAGCMLDLGLDGKMFGCVENYAKKASKTASAVNPGEVCRDYGENFNCLETLKGPSCSEEFTMYFLGVETQTVKVRCRGGTPSGDHTMGMCHGPRVFQGQPVTSNSTDTAERVQQCVRENGRAAQCLMINAPLSTDPMTEVQREVLDFDSYSHNVRDACATLEGFPDCVRDEIKNAFSNLCSRESPNMTAPVSENKDKFCRLWGEYVSCVESAVSRKCNPTSARQWTAISLSTTQPWCRDVIAASGAASLPQAIATNIFLVTSAVLLYIML